MPRKKTSSLPAVHAGSLLFIAALLPALQFIGTNIEYYAVAQILLVMWLGWVALQTYQPGLSVPRTPLALCLTLFWLWLALSLVWSPARHISAINFWWLGSLPLVFWIYTLSPDRAALWARAAPVVLVIGLALALMAIYQVYALEHQARSVFETRNTHAAFLNLVALPASAYFLLAVADKSVPRRYPVILGTALFVLFLSIVLTTSRGAILSLAIAMGLLVALAATRVPARALWLLAGLLVAAYLVTIVPSGATAAGVGERLPGLMQDAPRRLIWESSWNLLQDAPWHGIGLGLYYLAYPAYRNPADTTDGYFVHNDYLQVWIEIGLPGLALLLAVLIVALWLFVRALRKSTRRSDARVEMTGLFAGLLAVAGHSVVDFNLYILSIMMTAGLVLARFHELATGILKTPTSLLRPSRYLGRQTFPVIVVLSVLLPVFYFYSLGISNTYYEKGLAQAREGRLQEASLSLAAASRLSPRDERILLAHADLYRHAVATLAPGEPGRPSLYEDALRFLDQAERANPLRGLTFIIRGRLYQQNPDYAGENADELAADSFRRALALDPRLFQARMDYVSLLLQAGKKDEAVQSLEEGVRYFYPRMPELVPFYVLTAKFRREAGREQEALDLENRARWLGQPTDPGYPLRSR